MEERVYGGRYRATERIGSGGMAEVYKAVDQVLGRTVAVKVLHANYASDPTFVARFRQEAQAAANLSNPHIVNIYDWGQEDSTYYIVMEYVRGTDLKDLIEQNGPLDAAKAAEYATQVCSALSAAHSYDVIHRDIKPQNIVLTPDGQIKVMDFGIARAGNTTMTQTGSVLGTAQYISPEQAQGRPIGPASDLYSLGVVLYELTTGRLPFTADTPVAVALKQVNEEPKPPRMINPAIPPALEAVILHAMAKDPAQRYTSADEMRDDLRRVIAGQPVTAEPAAAMDRTSVLPVVPQREAVMRERRVEPVRRNWTWAWVLALIALVLLGGLLAYASGIFGPKPVPVPDVANLPVAEATSTIEGAGLKVGTITPQFSDTVKKGYVISTSPPAKTPISAGSSVDIVVSSGVQSMQVPDVSGMSQQNAITAIQQAGFKIGTIDTKYSGSVKAGNVISQDPAPGSKQPAGTSINLVVSQGVKQVSVPDVRGQNQSDAITALHDVGLKVATEKQNSSDVPPGQVISQNPGGGAQVASGSTVTIVVSSGPATTQVPDVMGKSEQAARTAIRDAGLLSSVLTSGTTDPNQDGKVLDQSPAGGATANKGSTVTITVGQLQSTTP